MLERKDGVIINISSVAGKRAWPLSGAGYSAAKFGVTALGSLPGGGMKDNGIRVSAICPGEVDTPILDQRPAPADGRASPAHSEARRRGCRRAVRGRFAAARFSAGIDYQASMAGLSVRAALVAWWGLLYKRDATGLSNSKFVNENCVSSGVRSNNRVIRDCAVSGSASKIFQTFSSRSIRSTPRKAGSMMRTRIDALFWRWASIRARGWAAS